MEIYLDNAATSHPKPPEVLEAVTKALTDWNGNPGRSGHARALRGSRCLSDCREALSNFLGIRDLSNLAFTFNCTDALNLAIRGVLHRGDHVISTALEHNSVLRPLCGLAESGQIELTLLTPQEHTLSPAQFVQALRPYTALAVVTQASNVTGALQPVADICAEMHSRGVRVLVDGAQAVGHLPVNLSLMKPDLYAFPGHKGLLGPQGTGGLFAAADCPLRPLREGGTGSSSDQMLQPTERPETFESGTVNLPGLCGLRAAIGVLERQQETYMQREQELTAHLLEGLLKMPGVTVYGPDNPAQRLGVVSFNVGDLDSSQAADCLDRHGICVRGGLHCAPGAHQYLGTLQRGAVRASIGRENTHEEIDALLRILRDELCT